PQVEERQVEAGAVEVVEVLDVRVAPDEAADGLALVRSGEEAEAIELLADAVAELLRQRRLPDGVLDHGEAWRDPGRQLLLGLLFRSERVEERRAMTMC